MMEKYRYTQEVLLHEVAVRDLKEGDQVARFKLGQKEVTRFITVEHIDTWAEEETNKIDIWMKDRLGRHVVAFTGDADQKVKVLVP